MTVDVPPVDYFDALHRSGMTIYDPIEVGHPTLWIPTPALESLLDSGLRGLSVAGLPLRTRSKMVKSRICAVLGYPVPNSFRKSQPRFPGQLFDTYVQKNNNLQIWNEELSAVRRYVLIRVSAEDVVTRVKVVAGDALARLDTTGTLTKKYQARCVVAEQATELISKEDEAAIVPFTTWGVDLAVAGSPVQQPKAGALLPIAQVYDHLSKLVGIRFADAGFDQERNRGAALHQLVCQALGYLQYQDDGQFPDVRHQLLEIKLQTSPTIDLGLVRPDSEEPLDVPMLSGVQVKHSDVRYAIFYATITEKVVTITRLYLTTGRSFFSRFPQFKGKVLNSKLQIPLPSDFFTN